MDRAFLQSVLGSIREGMVIMGANGQIEYANSAFMNIMGLARDDVVGMSCKEMMAIGGMGIPAGECPHTETLSTGRHTTRTIEHMDHHGWKKYIRMDASPVKSPEGEVSSVVMIVRDVTEITKAEKILMRYTEGLAILYELTTIFLRTKDLKGAINTSMRMIEGYYDADCAEIYFPDPGSGRLRFVSCTCQGDLGQDAEPDADEHHQLGYTYREMCPAIVNDYRDDGRFALPRRHEAMGIVAAVTVPMIAEDRIIGIMAILYKAPQDIDTGELWYLNVIANTLAVYIDKERYIERLGKSEAFLASVLEGIGEGVITLDRDFKILSANKSYLDIMKVTQEEAVGSHCYKISHNLDVPCDSAGEDCTVRRVFETGRSHSALHTHVDRDGNAVYVQTSAYPILDASGELVAAVETLMDVTEGMRLKRDLEKRISELEDFYEMAVGRELRMIELKEEIEGLRDEVKRLRSRHAERDS